MRKFVCINDNRTVGSEHFQKWCVLGEVYTLRRTGGSLTGATGLLFKELRNKPVYIHELAGYAEPSFNANRFVEISGEVSCKENEENFTYN
jgi:hypothetical protein